MTRDAIKMIFFEIALKNRSGIIPINTLYQT